MLIQQGDVLIKRVTKVPKGELVKKRNGRYVLAEGEVTGHAHATRDNIQCIDVNGSLYIKSMGDFTIVHEEHGAVSVPAGYYEIGIVQEYDHFYHEARKVVD